jgi:methylenetetrahydrofolate reductase (NADPH)
MEDLSNIFVKYLDGKIKKFPFSEGSIALETADISQILLSLNSNKLLTINSQPSVNASKSNHPKYGWGPENGYVYQKAYFEMFVHPDVIEPLVKHLDYYPDISYQALNLKGKTYQNVQDNDVNAVTWGVFRGREIIQPTVVDHQAFKLWKDESLNTFVDIWASIYKVKVDKDGNESGD